jgi:hypothetical protein
LSHFRYCGGLDGVCAGGAGPFGFELLPKPEPVVGPNELLPELLNALPLVPAGCAPGIPDWLPNDCNAG